MNREEFVEKLNQEGFQEFVTVAREPDGFLDEHMHPFEAKALILEGEILLRINDAVQVFRAGDVFHLHTNENHAERYGPEGVKYLVGRK